MKEEKHDNNEPAKAGNYDAMNKIYDLLRKHGKGLLGAEGVVSSLYDFVDEVENTPKGENK